MSTQVKISVARRRNVVVSLLRLEVQLRVIFATVACCWYFTRASDWMTSVERRRLASKMRCGWYQQMTPKSDARAGSKSIEKYFKERSSCIAQGEEFCRDQLLLQSYG
ncbi:hypothetical protein F511_14519 [Dorcoceras hygrometricum]|uniref:Uncharacterized protein n=1 Tax=Dorcoceras hygrometricum TaxID=472368 RepID=A0A2Z7BMV8_9LAMI|nr:hypothetical protein F511_14519 [Dorcoceras hygrometricum]